MAEEKNNSWKIITGVLAALLGWYTAGEIIDRYRYNQAIKKFHRQVEAITAPGSDPLELHAHLHKEQKKQAEIQHQEKMERALKPDEQCFDGQRFKRLENGWQQLPNRPC